MRSDPGGSGRAKPVRRAPGRVHGEVRGRRRSAWAAVYEIVRRIPRGRVMTYGQISTILGGLLSPRAVGWAMYGSPDDVPWQRVVNAAGACSTDRRGDMPPGLQRALLEAEGVRFRRNGTLDLARYRYDPAVRRTLRPRPSRRRGQEERG
jgi:methylated-DNA-protein-cysteine methyltransferase-like protein